MTNFKLGSIAIGLPSVKIFRNFGYGSGQFERDRELIAEMIDDCRPAPPLVRKRMHLVEDCEEYRVLYEEKSRLVVLIRKKAPGVFVLCWIKKYLRRKDLVGTNDDRARRRRHF